MTAEIHACMSTGCFIIWPCMGFILLIDYNSVTEKSETVILRKQEAVGDIYIYASICNPNFEASFLVICY